MPTVDDTARTPEPGRPSLARQIADLLSDRPLPWKSMVEERAAWFERKAALEERIAEESPFLADEARQCAAEARAEAARLRGEAGA